MGRGGIRRSRTHQMGKSNRPRISKLADEVTVLHSAPDLKYTDTRSQVGPWKRATKLLTGPQIERTRCGGTIVRPASRVSASRYSDVVEEHVNDHSSMNFMQDNEWSNVSLYFLRFTLVLFFLLLVLFFLCWYVIFDFSFTFSFAFFLDSTINGNSGLESG